MYTLYICRTLNVTMYVCALENYELKRVLNITYDSFAISVMSSFNKNNETKALSNEHIHR